MEDEKIKYQILLHKRLFKRLLLFYMQKNQHFHEAMSDALDAFEWLADFEYKDLYTHFNK